MKPSQTELDEAVQHIYNVSLQCFSYFVWWTRLKPVLGRHCGTADDISLQLVQNAIVEATLLQVRKLNEFFRVRPANAKPDDIRAGDFGFLESGGVLSEQDYAELHKRIGHITLHPIREGHVSWEIHNAVVAATNTSLSFLEHLINKFYVGKPAKQDELRTVKRAIEGFLERMRKAKELEEPS